WTRSTRSPPTRGAPRSWRSAEAAPSWRSVRLPAALGEGVLHLGPVRRGILVHDAVDVDGGAHGLEVPPLVELAAPLEVDHHDADLLLGDAAHEGDAVGPVGEYVGHPGALEVPGHHVGELREDLAVHQPERDPGAPLRIFLQVELDDGRRPRP